MKTMSFPSWLHPLPGGSPRARPWVETLEDRLAPGQLFPVLAPDSLMFDPDFSFVLLAAGEALAQEAMPPVIAPQGFAPVAQAASPSAPVTNLSHGLPTSISPSDSGLPRSSGSEVDGLLASALNVVVHDGGHPAKANYIFIDLNPSGVPFSLANGVSGGQQVGSGNIGGASHALLWTGSADSVVDLHPSGFTLSDAYAVSDGQQVGRGFTGGQPHALLWTGSADSVVDLHPSGFTSSDARGVSGGQQVGSGFTGSQSHALLWTGSADSVVDLHPSGFTDSVAVGISGDQQVGYGRTGGQFHALLWTGSADSVIDVHPEGFTSSLAQGVSGGQQVGYGYLPDGRHHALLWTGSADSVVDLHTFLPPQFTSSIARGIDADGNIVGYTSGPGGQHAFLLQRAP